MNMNGGIPTWEAITTSDTVAQNYYGVKCITAGTIVYKSEPGGADLTEAMAAGAYWPGRVVLVKTTGTSGTYAGAKAV